MKIMHSRARRFETAASLSTIHQKGSRAIDCAEKNPRSRTRKIRNGHQVFGRGAISSC